MTEFEFTLLSLSHSSDAKIAAPEEVFFDIVGELLSIFGATIEEGGDRRVDALQRNTKELRAKADAFIEKYKDVNIKVFQFRSYFQKLKENEYFFIRPGIPLSFQENLPLYNYLSSLVEKKEYAKFDEEFQTLFGELWNSYNILSFNESTKKPIGEQDKSKRVCRFCNNEREKVTFKNVAHAISESLGNKSIILHDECDSCNTEFGSGSGIENDLITFLKFYSSLYGIKGKKGIAKLKGKNFMLANEAGTVKLDYTGSLPDIKLILPNAIVLQNVYKTLCKYVLSVIPTELLPNFKGTIDWIRSDKMEPALPLIAILTSYSTFKSHPQLTVYIRKDEKDELPFAIGEFQFTFLTISFIIPFTSNDKTDFLVKENYQKYWDFFKHYSSLKEWEFLDFSDAKARPFGIQISLPVEKTITEQISDDREA